MPTPHAEQTYAPKPKRRRHGIGLCLSGGGFRAALFHLGAVRRLNEAGVLHQLTTISSVSGGSILAAHLATVIRWPLAAAIAADEWEEKIAKPFRAFTAQNIRTGPLLRGMFTPAASVELLAKRYETLTSLKLAELPRTPEFVFCATDMAYGVNWTFRRREMGDYLVGYVRTPADWPVARAVAASSCFPPIFNPLEIRFAPEQFRHGKAVRDARRLDCIRNLRLTDGGNYDNMGLEPVWKRHQTVLVSDGGATFDFAGDASLPKRILRYIAISDRQAHALRKRWLISSFMTGIMQGTYWGIGSSGSSYSGAGGTAATGYSRAAVQEVLSEIRTDLDAFSAAEAAVLENHGYLMASAALWRHLPELLHTAPAPSAPHPEWLDEARVRDALARSHERKMLGRR